MRRMPARDGEDVGKLLREPDRAPAAVEVGPNADDFRNARCPGSGNYLRQFFRKVRIIQVRVGIEESRPGCRHSELILGRRAQENNRNRKQSLMPQ